MRKTFLFVTFILFCLIPLFAAEVQPVDLVYTNPGENCAESMRIAFHSTESSAVLYWTKASDAGFKKAHKIKLSGTADTADFHEHEHFYKFGAELKKLSPDTEYIYKIKLLDGYESPVYSFKTAGNDGVFGFLWVSDVHTHPMFPNRLALAEQIAEYAEEQLDGDMYLSVVSGDDVCYGAFYDHWQQWQGTFLNHSVWALTPGNHNYYDILEPSGKAVMNMQWFEATQNQPKNGPAEQLTTFWFLYDTVLFLAVDCVEESYSVQQKKWMAKVIEENEGRYQYIIVYEHYPYMSAYTGGFSGGAAQYFLWQNIFDDYGVDVALSGDSHVYLETKRVYNKHLGKDDKGTVYIGAPQVGERGRDVTNNLNEELMENRISCSELADGSGMSYFKVTREGLTHVLIDALGAIRAETFIPARRPYPVKK